MKQSARGGRRIQRKNALATKRRSRRDAKHNQIYSNVQEMAPKSVAIVRSEPKLRITPVMQAEILRLYVQGCSLCEITRRTHRARQTVTKVVRAPDIQAMIQEVKARLLAEADDWAESLNFVVRTELNGAMAYKLARAFGVVPSLSKKAAPVKPQNDWAGVDPHQLAVAKVLALEARRRAALPPLERDDIEKLAPKDKVEPNRKARLFAERD